MAQGGIQQELNVLYTCSLSPSVSEEGTGRTVNAVTFGEGLLASTGRVIVWRIAERLKRQPVAPRIIPTKACRHVSIHLIVFILFAIIRD